MLSSDDRSLKNAAGWSKADDFSTSTRDAIARIAADPQKYAPSPRTDVVKVALETNPVMVFRASTTFRKSQRVAADPRGCRTIVSRLLQLMLDVGPSPAVDGGTAPDDDAPLTLEVCDFNAPFTPNAELYLPFIARLHGNDPDMEDAVTLALQVRRFSVKVDRNDSEDPPSTLSGLVVEYGSLDPNRLGVGPFLVPHGRVDSSNGFVHDDSGSWRAFFNEVTRNRMVPTDDDQPCRHYHSITVRLEDEVQLRTGEQIVINAFVLVRKRPAD